MKKRRRTSRRTRARRSWIWLPVVGSIVVLVVFAAALLARDVSSVRSGLLAAETELTDMQSALAQADLAVAREHLDTADEHLSDARSRSRSTLWNVAGVIPGAAASIDAVRGVIDVASAASHLADAALVNGDQLFADGLDLNVQNGAVDLAPITSAAEVVAGLPTSRLESALGQLSGAGHGWMPDELRDARIRAMDLGNDVLDSVHNGEALLSALPSYLGAEGPRTYFLGLQTSAELRGTGGLIGFYSLLTVDDGYFDLGTVDIYEALDEDLSSDDEPALTERIGALAGDSSNGVSASNDFVSRYEHAAANALFSNVNVDPDLPTTARVALDLYEERTGQALDGMILLDAIGLEAILEATDAGLTLPQDDSAGDAIPSELPADQFAEFVTVGVYEAFGSGQATARRDLLTAIGTSAFESVFDGGWDGARVGQVVANSASGRHLQVFSEQESEQAAFEQVGAAGRFLTDGRGDRLAVTVNNAVGGKQDVHLGHHTSVQMQLRGPHRGEEEDEAVVWRSSTVRSELHNPLHEAAYDPYIVGNCLVGDAENQCFEGPAAHNRSWYSVWTPDTDQLQSASENGKSIGLVAGRMHGHRVFDHYLETPPESQNSFDLELDGPVSMTLDGTELVYEFTWWRQSKGVPDILDLRIDAPEGWEVVESSMDGGSAQLPLLGPDADVPPAELSADPNGVSLEGAVSSDVTVRMRLARS